MAVCARSIALGLSLFAVLLLATSSARAAGLAYATWVQVTQGVPMTRTIAELGAVGSNNGLWISVSLTYPQFATTVFVPKPPDGALTLGYRITQGGPQHFIATEGMVTATRGVPGSVVLKTAAHPAVGVNQSMFMLGNFTLLRIPLN